MPVTPPNASARFVPGRKRELTGAALAGSAHAEAVDDEKRRVDRSRRNDREHATRDGRRAAGADRGARARARRRDRGKRADLDAWRRVEGVRRSASRAGSNHQHACGQDAEQLSHWIITPSQQALGRHPWQPSPAVSAAQCATRMPARLRGERRPNSLKSHVYAPDPLGASPPWVEHAFPPVGKPLPLPRRYAGSRPRRVATPRSPSGPAQLALPIAFLRHPTRASGPLSYTAGFASHRPSPT